MRFLALLIPLAAAAAGCSDDGETPTGPSGAPVSFFVTSQTSVTGNLGGLAGADATCQRLATAAGHGTNRIWRAYLSAERGPDGQPVHARDRIGPGPVVQRRAPAASPTTPPSCTRRQGDAALFVDERGQRINGQWTGSPGPGRARHPDGIERRRHPGGRADLRRLDLGLRRGRRSGRPLRRLRAEPEPGRFAVLVELRARQPELREHGAAGRGRTLLLLRAIAGGSRAHGPAGRGLL